jgi:PPOX class probable F420-dependent enzyme
MSYVMSIAERDQFLGQVRVGVLSVSAGDGRGPVAAPVWYHYQPGGPITVITGRASRKGRAIQAAGRVSLCVQSEERPYKYVTVEGPAVIAELDLAERLAPARRYLGPEGGDKYVAENPDLDGELAVIRIQPQHWLTVDFGKDAAS